MEIVENYKFVPNFIDKNFGQVGHWIISGVSNLVWYTLGIPLKLLYFNGPAISGIGFWEGRNPEDICSQITTIGSGFWIDKVDKQEACMELLDRKFNGFAITVIVLFYFTTILMISNACIKRIFGK